MIGNRDLRNRLQAATDTSFTSPSSTLAERMAQMAAVSVAARPSSVARLGRRFAAAAASVGIVGWMTMAGAGAMVTVAAVGELPDPVQQFVADVVEVIGIDLPDPAQEQLERLERRIDDAGTTPTTGGSSTTSGAGDTADADGSGANGNNGNGNNGNGNGNNGNGNGNGGDNGNSNGNGGDNGNSNGNNGGGSSNGNGNGNGNGNANGNGNGNGNGNANGGGSSNANGGNGNGNRVNWAEDRPGQG